MSFWSARHVAISAKWRIWWVEEGASLPEQTLQLMGLLQSGFTRDTLAMVCKGYGKLTRAVYTINVVLCHDV
jgi:hypothetical protein